nr:MAG TPA: hypothetical protein [Caudoviricetes sp.]
MKTDLAAVGTAGRYHRGINSVAVPINPGFSTVGFSSPHLH